MSGFVGGQVMAAAMEKWEVHGTYHLRPFTFDGVITHRLDLTQASAIAQLVSQIEPEVIIHTAAWGDLEKCERDPEGAFMINEKATAVIAERAASIGSRLVYVSTDMVFDGKDGNYQENSRVNPINVYGKAKLAGEKAVLENGGDTVVARAALIYGKPVTGSNSFSEKILYKLRRGETYDLYTDQFRSPVLVDDLARGLLELAASGYQGIMHLGGAERIDRFSLGECLSDITGYDKRLLRKIRMKDVRTEAPRPVDASLDIALAASVLKTKLHGVEEGLRFAYKRE